MIMILSISLSKNFIFMSRVYCDMNMLEQITGTKSVLKKPQIVNGNGNENVSQLEALN